MKDRQQIAKKQKDKQHYKEKTKYWATGTGYDLWCSGRLSSSLSTSETRYVAFVINLVISHEWGKACHKPGDKSWMRKGCHKPGDKSWMRKGRDFYYLQPITSVTRCCLFQSFSFFHSNSTYILTVKYSYI